MKKIWKSQLKVPSEKILNPAEIFLQFAADWACKFNAQQNAVEFSYSREAMIMALYGFEHQWSLGGVSAYIRISNNFFMHIIFDNAKNVSMEK